MSLSNNSDLDCALSRLVRCCSLTTLLRSPNPFLCLFRRRTLAASLILSSRSSHSRSDTPHIDIHPSKFRDKEHRREMSDKDHEALHATEDEEARRKKRRKWTIGITAFLIFQVVQALFFVLVILKFRSPKFRVTPPTMIQSLTVGTPASPSFDMSFIAPIQIKNTNWGPFKYDATAVYFTWQGIPVGQAYIPKNKANFKSTKKIDVGVNLKLDSANLPSNPNLTNDLSSGIITLSSQGELNGKVTVMFMFKKKKTSVMDCRMTILVSMRQILAWECE